MTGKHKQGEEHARHRHGRDGEGVRTGPATSAGRWATSAADDPAVDLTPFQEDLPVRLIATVRSALETCRADEELSAVVARNQGGYDYFPVTECDNGGRDRIIGLVELAPFMQGAVPRAFIRDTMRPLSEENLIGADASLLTFIREADRQRCRLVVSGPEIYGLVSLSDLQRLPARAALFAMVTQLEITMANAIRREFDHGEGWLEHLPPDRLKDVCKKVAKAKAKDAFVDTLLFTLLSDKVTIIRTSPQFPWNTTSFEENLDQVRLLRNKLAHANDYAATSEAAIGVCKTVRLMEQWMEWLAAWPSGPASNGGS